MPLDQLNYVAILAAGLVGGALFASLDLAAANKSQEHRSPLGRHLLVLFCIHVVTAVLMAFALAVLFNWYEPFGTSPLTGVGIAFFVAIGFAFPFRIQSAMRENLPPVIVLRQAVAGVLPMLSMGLILSQWSGS